MTFNILDKSVRIKISASWLIGICLAWAWLVRDFSLPWSVAFFPKAFSVIFLILTFAFIYRNVFFEFKAYLKEFIIFIAAILFIVFATGPTVWEALACDELYHASLASPQLHFLLRHLGENYPFLQTRPMPELVHTLNIILVTCFTLLIFIWNKCSKKILFPAKWLIGAGLLYGLASYFQHIPGRLEFHPPLRLLPLFVSQTLFGFDDFSFRLPGILAAAFAATACGKVVFDAQKLRLQNKADVSQFEIAFQLIATVLILTIPLLAHVATIVEPSVWTYTAWIFCFILINNRELNCLNSHRFILCGIVIGLFTLMRQNTLILWFPLGLMLLFERPPLKIWLLALLPGLFFLPTIHTMLNHPAAAAGSILNVWLSLKSGAGPFAILHSTTLPWVLILVGVCVFALVKKEFSVKVFYIAFVPAYVLYFMIWDFLWGMGRYQAEFIGSLCAISVVVLFKSLHKSLLNWIVLPVLGILIFGVCTLRTLNQDHSYAQWPQKKISTESVFPYRQSLGFLNRQDTSGKFVFLYGVPIYGEILFYIRGFSYFEIEQYKIRQEKFSAKIKEMTTPDQLKKTLSELDIKYIIVQAGDKREWQHRSGEVASMIALISNISKGNETDNVKLFGRFIGDYEGTVDIYSFGQVPF